MESLRGFKKVVFGKSYRERKVIEVPKTNESVDLCFQPGNQMYTINPFHTIGPEAATGGVLLKKVFLKISQISQRITCVGVSFQKSCKPEDLQVY